MASGFVVVHTIVAWKVNGLIVNRLFGFVFHSVENNNFDLG